MPCGLGRQDVHSPVRVATYNIRSCLGTDGVRSIERTASVIAALDVDAVALQEVDLERARSGRVNQAERIAERLGMHCVSCASLSDKSGKYGNAVLARRPMTLIRHRALPRARLSEPRSAMWVTVSCGDDDGSGGSAGAINLVNTHLSFLRADRPRQIKDLMGEHWLAGSALRARTILCGDLNCTPRDAHFRQLAGVLRDVQTEAEGRSGRRPRKRAGMAGEHSGATWPTRGLTGGPMRALDHILVTPDIEVVRVYVARSREARVASDHFPLVAALRIGGGDAAAE